MSRRGADDSPAAGPPAAEIPPPSSSVSAPEALKSLYARPGFKLRRAHQIAASVFAEACRDFEVTTTQYGVLVALSQCPGVDQIGLAQMMGFDRSTTGLVVQLLERRGLVRRSAHPVDRRRRLLHLTQEGEELVERVAPASDRAIELLMEPFSAEEAEQLAGLLDRLLEHHNARCRVPLLDRDRQ